MENARLRQFSEFFCRRKVGERNHNGTEGRDISDEMFINTGRISFPFITGVPRAARITI